MEAKLIISDEGYNKAFQDGIEEVLTNPHKYGLEKQGEQKPTIEMKTPEESLGVDSDTYNKIVDECIYGEQNHAWSEEDEINLERAIWYVENPKQIVIKNSMLVEWLKSLKGRVQPQSTWKPSEEQMDAINDAIDYLGGNTKIVRKHLMSLYEQLKKLKA